MKKLIVPVLCIVAILLNACNTDDDDNKQLAAIRAQLLGKWQIEKTIDEYYQPVNVLKEREEYDGTPADSAIFKNDNNLYVYAIIGNAVDEEIMPFKIINDSTISIDDEDFRIRKLTDHELILHQDLVENNKRYVGTGFFKR